MRIYGLRNCDSCRAARKALPDAEFVEVTDPGLAPQDLQLALDSLGNSLVNKRSTTWKQMSETDKELSVADQLAAHPKVMKRPLIIDGDTAYLGWTDDVKKALL